MQVRPLRRWRSIVDPASAIALMGNSGGQITMVPKYGDRSYLTSDHSFYFQCTHDAWHIHPHAVNETVLDQLEETGIMTTAFERRKDAIAALEFELEVLG